MTEQDRATARDIRHALASLIAEHGDWTGLVDAEADRLVLAAIAAARAEGRAEVEPFLAGLVESLGGEIFFPRNAEARTVEIDEDGEMIAVRSLE